MEIKINYLESVQKNISDVYEAIKKLKMKKKGLLKAIQDTQANLESYTPKVKVKKIVREKEWYEKFHWTIIENFLVIGGKDAQTNEILVRKYFEDSDLFFHADIHGASVVILKNGLNAPESVLNKTAQFAACFSSAWKMGIPISVYCVRKDQVKLAAKPGEYLPKGSFVLLGERKWFKNMELLLGVCFLDEKLAVLPELEIRDKDFPYILIKPDPSVTKKEIVDKLYTSLQKLYPGKVFEKSWLLEILPSGGADIVKIKP